MAKALRTCESLDLLQECWVDACDVEEWVVLDGCNELFGKDGHRERAKVPAPQHICRNHRQVLAMAAGAEVLAKVFAVMEQLHAWCVSVGVCERDRERDRDRQREQQSTQTTEVPLQQQQQTFA
jgi:hypothetical protein